MEVNTYSRVIVSSTHANTAFQKEAECYQAIGSQLAAVMLQMESARITLHENPENAHLVLAEMQVLLRETIQDIRARANGARS